MTEFDVFSAIARAANLPKVYPSYIARIIKRDISKSDIEKLIADVGPMKILGDCRYAFPVTDFNGTKYTITIEVAK